MRRNRCFGHLVVDHVRTSQSFVGLLGCAGCVGPAGLSGYGSVGSADRRRCWPYPQKSLVATRPVGWSDSDHHPLMVFRSCRSGSSQGSSTRHCSSSHLSTDHFPSPCHTQARHRCRTILGPLRVRGNLFSVWFRVDVSSCSGWAPLKLNPKRTKG